MHCHALLFCSTLAFQHSTGNFFRINMASEAKGKDLIILLVCHLYHANIITNVTILYINDC